MHLIYRWWFSRRTELGSFYSSMSNTRVHTWPSMTLMEEFYPEMLCASLAVLKENVTVPAGKYGIPRGMPVLCFTKLRHEWWQVRIGYIWLAKVSGVVKKKLVDITNYFDPLSHKPDHLNQVLGFNENGEQGELNGQPVSDDPK